MPPVDPEDSEEEPEYVARPEEWDNMDEEQLNRALDALQQLVECGAEDELIDRYARPLTEALRAAQDPELELGRLERVADVVCGYYSLGQITINEGPDWMTSDQWASFLADPLAFVDSVEDAYAAVLATRDLETAWETRADIMTQTGITPSAEVNAHIGTLLLQTANSICQLQPNGGNLAWVNHIDRIYQAAESEFPNASARFVHCASELADRVYAQGNA